MANVLTLSRALKSNSILRCRSITVGRSEVDDRDNGKRRQYGVKTDRGFQLDDTAGNKGADEVSQRRPEIMPGPCLPERSIGFAGHTDRYDPSMGRILGHSDGAQEYQRGR